MAAVILWTLLFICGVSGVLGTCHIRENDVKSELCGVMDKMDAFQSRYTAINRLQTDVANLWHAVQSQTAKIMEHENALKKSRTASVDQQVTDLQKIVTDLTAKIARLEATCGSCNSTDACSSNPCHNGGSCVSVSGGYYCDCSGNFTGTHCDQIDPCVEKHPCQNGGSCMNSPIGFACQCSQGFEGPTCDIKMNPCDSQPCVNGLCVPDKNSFTCMCDAGFAGKTCNETGKSSSAAPNPTTINAQSTAPSSACSSSPCNLPSKCIDHGKGNYTCECPETQITKNDPCVRPYYLLPYGFCCRKDVCKNTDPDCFTPPEPLTTATAISSFSTGSTGSVMPTSSTNTQVTGGTSVITGTGSTLTNSMPSSATSLQSAVTSDSSLPTGFSSTGSGPTGTSTLSSSTGISGSSPASSTNTLSMSTGTNTIGLVTGSSTSLTGSNITSTNPSTNTSPIASAGSSSSSQTSKLPTSLSSDTSQMFSTNPMNSAPTSSISSSLPSSSTFTSSTGHSMSTSSSATNPSVSITTETSPCQSLPCNEPSVCVDTGNGNYTCKCPEVLKTINDNCLEPFYLLPYGFCCIKDICNITTPPDCITKSPTIVPTGTSIMSSSQTLSSGPSSTVSSQLPNSHVPSVSSLPSSQSTLPLSSPTMSSGSSKPQSQLASMSSVSPSFASSPTQSTSSANSSPLSFSSIISSVSTSGSSPTSSASKPAQLGPCKSSPCNVPAKCIETGNGNYTCQCPEVMLTYNDTCLEPYYLLPYGFCCIQDVCNITAPPDCLSKSPTVSTSTLNPSTSVSFSFSSQAASAMTSSTSQQVPVSFSMVSNSNPTGSTKLLSSITPNAGSTFSNLSAKPTSQTTGPCDSSPCNNPAYCIDTGNGNYSCKCPEVLLTQNDPCLEPYYLLPYGFCCVKDVCNNTAPDCFSYANSTIINTTATSNNNTLPLGTAMTSSASLLPGPCDSSPCNAPSTCFDSGNGNYTCECPDTPKTQGDPCVDPYYLLPYGFCCTIDTCKNTKPDCS